MLRLEKPTDYRGQRVLLVGLGLHGGGVATVKWLVRQGAIVRVTDIQSADALASSVRQIIKLPLTLHLGGYRPSDWTWADRIILNPGVPPTIPSVKRAARSGIPIENEASIFLQYFPGPVLGVTGTRGKTTTTLLLGAILSAAHRNTIISGNVRDIPMLAYLPTTTDETWAVVELSSYQLERLPVIGRPLHVAVMTNLMVDHINRHGSMQAYARTKYNIFPGQTAEDVKILHWHDRYCRLAASIGRGRVVWFGTDLPLSVDAVTVKQQWVVEQRQSKTTRLFPLSIWKLPGGHNIDNLLAAVAAARAMGISSTILRRTIRSFRGVPYRQQIIRSYRGHRFINDTAATSPDATLAALSVFPQGLFIVGGTNKGLDLRSLATALIKKNVATVFLPGTATLPLQRWLRQGGYRRPLVTVHSMASAVKTALALAKPRQDIVLSPGAASFGLFRHEFDRGDRFNKIVESL